MAKKDSSKAINNEQIALLSASVRHARSARFLLEPFPDQAWHLAGFAFECVRKACLVERWGDKSLGHLFEERGEELLSFLVALDSHAWRYSLHGWDIEHPLLLEWNPNDRYKATGSCELAKAKAFTEEAEVRVFSLLAELWADGRLSEAPN